MLHLFTWTQKNKKLLTIAFFASLFLVISKTFRDYGITWDEEYHLTYGRLIIDWYRSFFKDTGAITHEFLVYYGGFFDALCQLISTFGSWDTIETRHFLGALFGLWSIFMSFKIARHIAGDLAGFFAALFLGLNPVFYGHMFNNPVDIPFGALAVTTLYCIITSHDFLPKIPTGQLIKTGVVLGLALGIRIAGLFVLAPCFGVSWLLWFLIDFESKKKLIAPILKNLARNAAIILITAWPVMILWWPIAETNPIVEPFKVLALANRWSRFHPSSFTVFFEGIHYPPLEVPEYYTLKLILLTIPEFYFAVLLIGICCGFLYLNKSPKLDSKESKIILLIFILIYPLLVAFLAFAPRFDGYRHYLFLMPVLASLCGISFAALLRSHLAKAFKSIVLLIVSFSMVLTAFDMFRLHPYQTVYYNRLFAGGLKNAAKNYETDFWGNSVREGVLWVMNNYHPGFNRKILVETASWPYQVVYYWLKNPELASRFEIIDRIRGIGVDKAPDIFIATTRFDCHKAYEGYRILYKVERDHAPLLYIYEVPEGVKPHVIKTC